MLTYWLAVVIFRFDLTELAMRGIKMTFEPSLLECEFRTHSLPQCCDPHSPISRVSALFTSVMDSLEGGIRDGDKLFRHHRHAALDGTATYQRGIVDQSLSSVRDSDGESFEGKGKEEPYICFIIAHYDGQQPMVRVGKPVGSDKPVEYYGFTPETVTKCMKHFETWCIEQTPDQRGDIKELFEGVKVYTAQYFPEFSKEKPAVERAVPEGKTILQEWFSGVNFY